MAILSLSSPTKSIEAYLAAPAGAGRWPGVVVLHDIMGFTEDVRRQADWLAAAGYVAVAPNLYSGGRRLACIRAVFRDLSARRGATFDDIEAVRAQVAQRANCTGKVGIIGFCMGGGFALVAAAGHGFSASSVNYGMVPPDVETILAGACPVVGSFGARDFALKGAAARLDQALAAQDVPRDVKEYPDASHGFLNTHGGALGWVMGRFGLGFKAEAASDAQRRITDFFGRHLGAADTVGPG